MSRLDYLEYAVLGELPPGLPPRQFMGLPPELTGGVDVRRALPPATLRVLARETDGSISLYRFGAGGSFAGATWHPDVADAKEQAAFEYGNAVGDWRTVPDDVTELEVFVRSLSS